MAEKWDRSPPQNLIILACAVGSALLLFTLKFGFDAYYSSMFDSTVAHQQTRYDDTEEVREIQAGWDRALENGGRMSIGAAMTQLSTRGRNGFPELRPQPPAEMNIAPLEGWIQLPQEVDVPPPAPEPEAALPQGIQGVSPEALQQLEQALRGALQPRPTGGGE